MSTVTSAWQTGTYDLLVHPDPEGGPGDLMVVVFAAPTDIDDVDADEDAPILASRDVIRGEYDQELGEHQLGTFSIGEKGLLQPEDVEKVYGPRLAARILLSLYEAADNDFRGIDVEGHPWRLPESGAFPLMARVHPLLMDLRRRLFGN